WLTKNEDRGRNPITSAWGQMRGKPVRPMAGRLNRGANPVRRGMMDRHIAVIGGGPAGLMAAEILSTAGLAVTVFDARPTVGRKFLMAGKSGLNIANVEEGARLRGRYGEAAQMLAPALGA